MIAICPNPFRDMGCALTLKLQEMLQAQGFETCICPVFSTEEDGVVPPEIQPKALREVAEACTLIVVVGGDGTILHVAREIHAFDVPLLGVNLGSKGFMAALEPDEIAYVLDAAKGKYTLSKRMKLDVSLVRGGEVICRDQALNDVVMHGYGDCIKITASCNGNRITAFSGDGIILSTPTGSTGYSMSAGGPIVEPNAENIIISPICAHMMSSRSFVLSPESLIEVDMDKQHGRRAYLSVDGNSVMDLAGGDRLLVRRSDSFTWMADLGLRNFYEIAFEKLR